MIIHKLQKIREYMDVNPPSIETNRQIKTMLTKLIHHYQRKERVNF